jgi:phosphate:Na+ symporter
MLRHVQILLSFAGSLGLMVFGLRMLNDRILYSFGSRIRSRIIAASGQSFRSLIAGSSLTSMFHSSSGLSVILMSMINESLISQEAAFTTVLGAALGHIVPIAIFTAMGFLTDMSTWALPLLALAVPMSMLRRRNMARFGVAILGFLILLLGLELLKQTLPSTSEELALLLFVRGLGARPFLFAVFGLGLGVLLSIMTQSSDTVILTALALGWSGWFPFSPVLAMIFGANVGTILTLRRGSGVYGSDVRVFSAAVVIFLVLTGAVGLALVLPLEAAVIRYLPGIYYKSSVLPSIAYGFYAGFTVLVILLMFVLRRWVMFFAVHWHRRPTPAAKEEDTDGLPVLPRGVPDSLEANLITTRGELGRMADTAHGMLLETLNASQNELEAKPAMKRVKELHSRLEESGGRVEKLLKVSIREPSGADQARDIAAQTRVSQELIIIGSACVHAVRVVERIARKNYRIHEEAMDELYGYISQVLDFLKYDGDYLARKLSRYDRKLAYLMEEDINSVRDKLQKRVRRTLERDDEADIRGEFQFMDIVRYLELIGDGCLTIGRELPKLR